MTVRHGGRRKATYSQKNLSFLSFTTQCWFYGLVGGNNCPAGNKNG